jgi:hypothetical protein
MRPILTEAHWKKAGGLAQGWGAVQNASRLSLVASNAVDETTVNLGEQDQCPTRKSRFFMDYFLWIRRLQITSF